MSERRSWPDRATGGLPAAALSDARAALGSPEQVEQLRSKLATSLGAAGVEGRADTLRGHGSEAGAKAAAAASQPPTAAALKIVSLVVGLTTLGTAVWIGTRTPSGDAGDLQDRVPRAAPALAASVPSSIAPEPAPPPTAAAETPPQLAVPTPAARTAATKPRPAHHLDAKRPLLAHPKAATASAQESEVELVTRAQSLLDSQPRAALEALRVHEQLYPRGMLREEREVLRIDAEWSLGERTRALTHALDFVQRYPHSAQTRRFNRLLDDHKNGPAATRTE